MPILVRVIQILLMIAVVVLCYYLIVWVLGLLGIVIPGQILTVVMVIIALCAILAILTGRFDNLRWW